MPAKAILAGGRYWYVAINHAGLSKKLTSWRNHRFSEEIARFLEGVINQQVLSGHFHWSDWFPRMRRKYLWKEAYWTWEQSKLRAPATTSNIKYKYQHYEALWNRDIRELHQVDFLWIREVHGDTHKAKAIRQIAQAFLNWAHRTEMLDRQIFLPPVDPPKRKTPYLDLETRWAIHEGMSAPYRDPMLLGLEMGLRIGEICALQWGDIDWEGQGINVCHTISAYTLKDSRKGGDEVWLPMTEKVKEMLSRLKQERNAIAGYLFTHTSGRQLWTQQVSSAFKSACRILGIPQAKFHHLRNSFLHDLSEAGATTREAGALAGHKSERTTERYIGRWSHDKIRSIANLRKRRVST